MNKDEREAVVAKLKLLAAELSKRPKQISDSYDERSKADPTFAETRWARQVGALEALTEGAGRELEAIISIYLTPSRRSRKDR